MLRFHLTLAIAVLSVLVGPVATAAAHELSVTPPGPVRLDLGTGDPVRLVHATLGAGEELIATIRVPAESVQEWKVQTLALTRPGTDSDDQLVDDATTVEYRILREVPLASYAERAGVRTITVSPGDEPGVALRVAPAGAPFTSEGLARAPRSLVRLRAWVEASTPATVDTPAERRDARAAARRMGQAGLGIALVGVLVAAWWVLRGRTRSRVRGVERAREDS
ncbi:MAG: hypothetical protein JWM86_475 [Thermoleophilia bacterium]|nr:hypothetical protein [Thermoleophilia bacterium]